MSASATQGGHNNRFLLVADMKSFKNWKKEKNRSESKSRKKSQFFPQR